MPDLLQHIVSELRVHNEGICLKAQLTLIFQSTTEEETHLYLEGPQFRVSGTRIMLFLRAAKDL